MPPEFKRNKFLNAAILAVRNLSHKKLRSVLTSAGVVIGVGAVVFVLSFGLGMQRIVANKVVGAQQLNTIDVTSSDESGIPTKNVRQITSIPQVQSAVAIYSAGGKAIASSASLDTVIYGVDTAYFPMTGAKVLAGKPNISTKQSIVINATLATALGYDKQAAIGKRLPIAVNQLVRATKTTQVPFQVSLTISAVVDSGRTSEVYLSSLHFSDRDIDGVTSVKLLGTSGSSVASIKASAMGMGYLATSPRDALNDIVKIFRVFNIVIGSIGAIGIVVGVIGMFNTLTISLAERTREIGLMIILGTRRAEVCVMFILESLSLSVIGGLAGLLAAVGLGKVLNISLTRLAHSRGANQSIELFYVPPQLFIAALGFAFVLGFLVVLYPMFRGIRVDPIETLRRD